MNNFFKKTRLLRSILSANTPANDEKILKDITLIVSAVARIMEDSILLISKANNVKPTQIMVSPINLMVCGKLKFGKKIIFFESLEMAQSAVLVISN